jgi:uncharacterized protein YbjT (DUF2867 family)
MADTKVALVAGTTGFVGGLLLDALLGAPEYSRVYAITRRPTTREHLRLANRIVRFERIEADLKGLAAQDAFCCLGTTISAAGSEAEFRKVDVDAVMAFARAAKNAGVQRFVVVTSAGANPAAKNFYLRVKGEVEALLAGAGFQSLDIIQPGLLLGWRSQMRPLEMLGRLVMPIGNLFLVGEREQLRGIAAAKVALAMLGAARSGRRGVYRYTYRGILQLAESRPRTNNK